MIFSMCIDLGCNFHQVITLLVEINGVGSDRYKFRVQLSCADPCHCVTIGRVSEPFSESIRDKWDDLWNDQDMLCANANKSKSFESEQFKLQNRP